MSTLKYILLFVGIQAASAVLFVVGLPIIATLVLFKAWKPAVRETAVPGDRFSSRWIRFDWKGGKLTWLWGNDEDGIFPYWYMREHLSWSTRRLAFTWTALRNSVNNLRYVRGVSKVGRPLYYRTFQVRGKEFYVKAGWMSDGFPCLSAGAGRGY